MTTDVALPNPASDRPTRWQWLLLMLIVVLAIALRLLYLGRTEADFDELWHLELSTGRGSAHAQYPLFACGQRSEHALHRQSWIEDGRPAGFFWRAAESDLFISQLARVRLSISWLFVTPVWIGESQELKSMLHVYFVQGLAVLHAKKLAGLNCLVLDLYIQMF